MAEFDFDAPPQIGFKETPEERAVRLLEEAKSQKDQEILRRQQGYQNLLGIPDPGEDILQRFREASPMSAPLIRQKFYDPYRQRVTGGISQPIEGSGSVKDYINAIRRLDIVPDSVDNIPQ